MIESGVDEKDANVSLYTHRLGALGSPAKYTFDVTTLRDPNGQGHLKRLTGLAKDVINWMRGDPKLAAVRDEVLMLCHAHITGKRESFITIAFADHHGRWIGPAVAEILAESLTKEGFRVSIKHHNLD